VNLDTRLQALIDDFAPIDDLQERLSLVVDRARRHPPLPAETRLDAHRVLGCISAVWLTAELRDGCLHFHADADSPLVRGLVVFLVEFFNDSPPAEIAANAPLAVQASKRMMRMGLNETFPDHVHHVYLQLLPLFKTQDMAEGMRAFLEKRTPDFKGQ
jgi:sulfur transfer protein SufE